MLTGSTVIENMWVLNDFVHVCHPSPWLETYGCMKSYRERKQIKM